MNKVSFSNKFIFLCFAFVFSSTTSPLFAADTSRGKPHSVLIQLGVEDKSRIPLILIHGIHGSEEKECKFANVNDYWEKFRTKFDENNNRDLRESYALYIFQFCSDQTEVRQIGDELGELIDEDENLKDKNHYLIAHSFGGLVAKSYMVYYQHKSGRWQGQKGGYTTLELITLATPHHGTPGANSPVALDEHFPATFIERTFKIPSVYWKLYYQSINFTYWNISSGFLSPSAKSSTEANRSDLRWDNFNNRISLDINTELKNTNQIFKQYVDKVILYAGVLSPQKPRLGDLDVIVEKKGAAKLADWLRLSKKILWIEELLHNPHEQLSFADGILYYGLGGNFGFTDGLVPYESSLFCDSGQYLWEKGKIPPNFICNSPSRVRRFEFEDGQPPSMPNEKTLSIDHVKRGFDHQDMFEHYLVLNRLFEDLRKYAKKFSHGPYPIEPPVKISQIPTLFLFDVSGSMNENGKINDAREAGLDALRVIRERGGNSSPVSIMTFSGDSCGGNVTRNLLPFTNGLSQAETVMRSLPPPNGGTPLPQAKDAAWAEMQRFLAANPNVKEGGIVLLSDGQSTCGAIRPAGVYSRREDSRVSRSDSKIKFFTIGLDVPAGSIAERDLQYLASETGGKYFPASDRRQLIRAFQKQVRRFAPRSCSASNTDFSSGLRAFADSDYNLALESFQKYAAANPNDSCGIYNLALAFEANDRYKTAAEYYRQYLNLASPSSDRAKIERKIAQLNQDYTDQFDYFIKLIQSDADYLKRYYDTIFNRSSADLAQEFNGFVYEKGGFYKALPEILEVNERWLTNDAKDISSSINTLAKRSRLESFDRDAVSLLTDPIAGIEDLLERLRNYQANNFR